MLRRRVENGRLRYPDMMVAESLLGRWRQRRGHCDRDRLYVAVRYLSPLTANSTILIPEDFGFIGGSSRYFSRTDSRTDSDGYSNCVGTVVQTVKCRPIPRRS